MSSQVLDQGGVDNTAAPANDSGDTASNPVLDHNMPQAAGLSSPPDSNNARKLDGSDSELSDIEDGEEDIGDVQPDSYDDGGRVPIFKPTMHQFKSFKTYMNKINPWGMKSGIVKVIPPPEWRETLPNYDETIKKVKINSAIKQEIMGSSGQFRQANILHQRSYNLPQWRQLCEQSEHQPPAKRGERRGNPERATRSSARGKAEVKPEVKAEKATDPSAPPPKKRGPGRPPKNKPKPVVVEDAADAETNGDRLPTPVSPAPKADGEAETTKADPDQETESVKPKFGSRQGKVSVSSRRKYNRREEPGKADPEAFKDFKYEWDGEPFTRERCEELEKAYWKTLTYAPPLYGADLPGSLFDDRTTTWNLSKLENLLDVLGTEIPGVNTAYLYLGMWKATFAWHLEDVDLYSINYLHFGAPKQWYSISQGDARRFEAAMKNIWPVDAKACDQFLRHKTFLISPSTLLSNYNVKVNKIVHHPGEFVITFPYGYHSGYNLGYNCAEAVNFALESWLDYGRIAKKCDCDQAQDSVWIDVKDIERKLRGESTEVEESSDEEEEEDDEDEPTDLPTPPESSSDGKPAAPKRKRKRPTTTAGREAAKRIRLSLKAKAKVPVREPCILCPNDVRSESLLPTDNGQKAHRICAEYIPETRVEGEGKSQTVADVAYIDKARLELKCNYCRSKKGACFQCSSKKCTRAYHATCAAAAGVLVQQGEIPVFGEDGTEYKQDAIDFRCRFHRVKREKKLDSDALDDAEHIRKVASELVVGQVCQFQFYRGDIFAGAVVENRLGEETLLVDIMPRGDRVEVEYKWMLVLDPADYCLPKPSANAIPLPTSRAEKDSLVTSERQANDNPREGDLFIEGYKWQEFSTEKIPRNAYQEKVDLSKENKIWFYLGKTSTEARAQYTEDPSRPVHNPKGNFLDTLPKPAPAVSRPRQSFAATYPTGNINQHALNAARATGRSPLSTASTVKPSQPVKQEKPYVYKPKTLPGPTGYQIDQRSFQSQQNFLKNAAPPLSFGTDPSYRPGHYNSGPPVSPLTPIGSQPTFRSFTRPAPPTSQTPSQHASVTPSQHASVTPVRPSQSSTPVRHPQPIKPGLSGSTAIHHATPGRSGVSSSRYAGKTNLFTKYPYLQKEHNKSPTEYKSPYAPEGGFMNGYEGDFRAHAESLMAKGSLPEIRSISSHSITNPLNPRFTPPHTHHQNRLSVSSSSGASPSRPSYSAAATFPLPAMHYNMSQQVPQQVPQQAQQPLPRPVSKPASTYERPSYHPAIRQSYNGGLFHRQYSTDSQPQQPQGAANTYQPGPTNSGSAYQSHQSRQLQQSPSSRFIPLSQQAVHTPPPLPSPYSPHSSASPFSQTPTHPAIRPTATKPLYPHQQYFQAQNTRLPQQQSPQVPRAQSTHSQQVQPVQQQHAQSTQAQQYQPAPLQQAQSMQAQQYQPAQSQQGQSTQAQQYRPAPLQEAQSAQPQHFKQEQPQQAVSTQAQPFQPTQIQPIPPKQTPMLPQPQGMPQMVDYNTLVGQMMATLRNVPDKRS